MRMRGASHCPPQLSSSRSREHSGRTVGLGCPTPSSGFVMSRRSSLLNNMIKATLCGLLRMKALVTTRFQSGQAFQQVRQPATAALASAQALVVAISPQRRCGHVPPRQLSGFLISLVPRSFTRLPSATMRLCGSLWKVHQPEPPSAFVRRPCSFLRRIQNSSGHGWRGGCYRVWASTIPTCSTRCRCTFPMPMCRTQFEIMLLCTSCGSPSTTADGPVLSPCCQQRLHGPCRIL